MRVAQGQGISKSRVGKRERMAAAIEAFNQTQHESERGFALHHGLAPTTFHEALRRHERLADGSCALFLSAAGERWLRLLVCALHVIVVSHAGCGIRTVTWLLDVLGLGEMLATSFEAHRTLHLRILSALGEFEDLQARRLAGQAPGEGQTLALDETFFRHLMLLVAVEPGSRFVVVEREARERDTRTWRATLLPAMARWGLTLAAVCSDQAGALIRLTADLDADHIPDLFHVQQPLCRHGAGSLARQHARDVKSQTRAEDLCHQAEEAWSESGRRRDERAWRQAHDVRTAARRDVERSQALLTRFRDGQGQVREAWHPFDMRTGQAQDGHQVEERLRAAADQLATLCFEEKLSQKAWAGVHQLRALIPQMAASVERFHEANQDDADERMMSEESRGLDQRLIAVAYGERVAARTRGAEEREALRERVARWRLALEDEALWAQRSASEREILWRRAHERAATFHRSSSCVEGRNAWLGLHHHAWRRISPARLRAIGVVHNFLRRGRDGKTPAERLFRTSHPDPIRFLLDVLPDLPFPRPTRSAA